MTEETQVDDNFHPRARSNRILAASRFLLLLGRTAQIAFAYFIRVRCRRQDSERLRVLYRGTQAWLTAMASGAGFSISSEGVPPENGAFLAPNHVTYADIVALSTVVPTWYVAKADVLGWPLFNWIFRFSRNLTVDRTDIRRLQATNAAIAQRINDGYNVCVFLEGTSSAGDDVLPFRAPLLQPALDGKTDIVPVHIQWSATDPDIIIGDDIAYWREHVILPHAIRLLGFRGLHCHVTFGKPIVAEGDRKELAGRVRDAVLALKEASSQ